MKWLTGVLSFADLPELPEERYAWSWSGIIDPVKNRVDDIFRNFLGSLANKSARACSRVGESVTYEYSDTLTEFAQRAAVFALRDEDSEWISSGMTAIGLSKSDIRDMDGALKLLIHCAARLGADVDSLLKMAARISIREHREYLLWHLGKANSLMDPRAIDRVEVQTPGGVGFAKLGSESYNPSHDLGSMIVELSELVDKNGYHLFSVEIASEVPVGQDYLGAVSIDSALIATENPRERWRHQLQIFLAETTSEGDAQKLQVSVKKKKPSSHLVLTARAEGNLFCLVAARSLVNHLVVIETPESLTRFSDAAAGLFRRALREGKTV